MKIGVVNISYNCFDTLPAAFESWIEIKQGALKEQIDELYLTSVACCFTETAELGYDLYSKDGSIEYLDRLSKQGILDKFALPAYPQTEVAAWNYHLPFLLEQKIDCLIMVNSDEIHDLQEISNLIKFIQKNELIDYFKIQFRNYVFNDKTWTTDFRVPRAWFVNRNGGAVGMYCDDLFSWKNKKDVETSHLLVPPSLVSPRHLSWCGSPAKLKRKCEFGQKRYKLCSFLWNEEKQTIEFNKQYYQALNKPIPELYHD